MAILDVDRLLEPVSDDSPCGPNLEYDDTYSAFERAARGKCRSSSPANYDTPPSHPNGAEVRRLGVELVGRTKDLRVACQLAQGAVRKPKASQDFAATLGTCSRLHRAILANVSIRYSIPTTTTIPRCVSTRWHR